MDIITIIVLTGITNLTFSFYSWQQIRNPESHHACKAWAQAHFIKAVSYVVYAIALINYSDDLRLFANILILMGCWAEVRAYNKLAGAKLRSSYLWAGFIVTSAIFTYMHIISGSGPNNTMITTASLLLVMPLSLNVYTLYQLLKSHPASLFPRVLVVINATMTLFCLIRVPLSINNPEFIITQALFANQAFMFFTFIHALGNGIGFIGFLKERSDEKLSTRANIDYLTGIHNRQYFERLTRARIDEKMPFTLYFLDIDKFKSVNDRFGHATGDEVLRLFSLLLLEIQDQHQGVAGRLGGEEFGLLLPAATTISHEKIFQQLRQQFANQTESLISEPISFCHGACASQNAQDVHELMRNADVLLYKAKRELS